MARVARSLGALSLGLFALWGGAACSSGTDEPKQEPKPSDKLRFLPAAREFATVDALAEDLDQDGNDDRYRVSFPKRIFPEGQRVTRSVTYQKANSGDFDKSLEWDLELGALAPEALTFEERIPKSFAADAADLQFSHQPTVLEADPLVSWNLNLTETQSMNAQHTSPAPASEAATQASEVAFQYQYEACEAIEDEAEADACVLALVERFPTAPEISQVAASCDPSDLDCAAIRALSSGDWQTHCGALSGEAVRKCYVDVWNARVDGSCSRATDESARSSCALSAWQQIGDTDSRDWLCYDLEAQRAVRAEFDWGGFGRSCAAEHSPEHCDSIADNEVRRRCIGAYARATQDISLCHQLGEIGAYDAIDCQFEYAYALYGSASDCSSQSGDAAQLCYIAMAIKLEDPNLCKQLTSESGRNQCIVRAVRASASFTDATLCDQIVPIDGDTGKIDYRFEYSMCVLSVMRHANDLTLCQKIDADLRAWCDVANALLEEEPARACSLLESSAVRCECLAMLALANSDRVICGALPNTATQSACTTQLIAAQPAASPIFEACRETLCIDADHDSSFAEAGCDSPVDCRDDDSKIHPDRDEVCDDEIDNDCNEAVDCADVGCRNDPKCENTQPTEVVVTDHSGVYTIKFGFAGGEGTSYRFIPESELGFSVYGWGELLAVALPSFPKDPGLWDSAVPVTVSISGAGLKSWRIYPASNSWDPASRNVSTYWDITTDPIPMRGDRYYWLDIYPESGPYASEVIQLQGALE